MNLRQKSSRYSGGVLFCAGLTAVSLVVASVSSGFETGFEIWLACCLVASLILHARAGFALSKAQQEVDLLQSLVQKFKVERRRAELSIVDGGAEQPEAENDALSLDRVNDAIENGRVDLYLQPIFDLDDRKAAYFEAFSRLRNRNGTIIQPADYIEAAERFNKIGLIDNMILLRAVQALRQFGQNNPGCRIFCNISPATIFDKDFFLQFTDYLDANKDLAEQLVFEFTYPAIEMMNGAVDANLALVAKRGYAFSVDHIGRFDIDWNALRKRNFRYAKASSALLLGDRDEAAHRRAAALVGRLGDIGVELIAEKIESHVDAQRVQSLGIRFGQGTAFAPPRPARVHLEGPQKLAAAS